MTLYKTAHELRVHIHDTHWHPGASFHVGELIEEINTLEGIRFRCKACVK